MSNIKYIVKYKDELSYNGVIFSEHETEKQALAKVNELMIATNNDTTKWQDGQERDFLDLCGVITYDLTDDIDIYW
jgi:hypothetical protein